MALPTSRVTDVSRFSQRARVRDEVKSKVEENGDVKPQESLKDEQRGEREKDSKPKKKAGFTVPAFGIFAIGLPLGWFLNDYRPFGRSTNSPDPSTFTKYTLISKDDVSSTAAIFRLKPSSSASIDLDDPSLERAITSVEFKQPQLQIARSYTRLPQEHGQHMDELRFLIRRERKGEVSNYLHKLPVNAEIEVRGLHPEYVVPEDVKSVAFLVGGTGIAPAMQAADIVAGEADIHILWASRRREDCIGGYNDTTPSRKVWSLWPSSSADASRTTVDLQHAEKGVLVSILESLKKRSVSEADEKPRLAIDYFVDEEGASIRPETIKQMLSSLSKSSSNEGRKLLFVSGPEGFLSHWAGPKQWADGREVQGPLRGALSTLDLAGWEVIKL